MDNRPLDKRLKDSSDRTKDCWNWIKSVRSSSNPYGQIRYQGKIWIASRLSWVHHRGPIPEGLCVLHKCDNPKCINPEHLYLGTNKDNTKDILDRGRRQDQRGERNPNRRLSTEDVEKIKAMLTDKIRQKDIAAKFGVTQSCVSHINTRRNRTHE